MADLRAVTTPVELEHGLLDLLPGPDDPAWVREGEGMVGWGRAVEVDTGAGPERFRRAAEGLADLANQTVLEDEVGVPGGGLVAFASFTFDDRSHGSVLLVPSTIVGRRDGRTWVTRIGPTDDLPGAELPSPSRPSPVDRVRYAGASVPDLHWLQAVADAIGRIRDGDVDKVVLARDHAVWSREPFDARVLLRRLAARFPACFTFSVDGLVGATPELLIRRNGRDVSSRALAGTTGRSEDPETDRALGQALLRSAKDRAEHAYAASSVREVLEPRSEELHVDEEPSLLRLANVQHLATDVHGRLSNDETALDLAAALHPTAAVGGVPTRKAVDLIRELEGMDRGRYAGPVGWIAADGDGEFGIALRCAQLSGARARLFAGAGIVAGSLPEDELEETRLKLGAMRSAFEGGSDTHRPPRSTGGKEPT